MYDDSIGGGTPLRVVNAPLYDYDGMGDNPPPEPYAYIKQCGFAA